MNVPTAWRMGGFVAREKGCKRYQGRNGGDVTNGKLRKNMPLGPHHRAEIGCQRSKITPLGSLP